MRQVLQVNTTMNLQNFEQAIRYAEQRLERDLAPHFVYHDIGHTRDEVVPAVELLADREGITGKHLLLLRTAAWYHDLGYIENPVHHELIGARMAVEILPSFGYSKEDIEVIRWAILATALPQSPNNLLEQILTDADLDVLGTTNFMKRNEDLRRELGSLGKEFSDEQWYRQQLKFITGHQYFTASAHALRDSQKIININELKQMIEVFDSRNASQPFER